MYLYMCVYVCLCVCACLAIGNQIAQYTARMPPADQIKIFNLSQTIDDKVVVFVVFLFPLFLLLLFVCALTYSRLCDFALMC